MQTNKIQARQNGQKQLQNMAFNGRDQSQSLSLRTENGTENGNNQNYFALTVPFAKEIELNNTAEHVAINKLKRSTYFNTMTQLNSLKSDHLLFNNLINLVHNNDNNDNNRKINDCLTQLCEGDLNATIAKIKSILKIKSPTSDNLEPYPVHELFYVFSLVCEKFGAYEDAAYNARQAALSATDVTTADQLFERSLTFYTMIKNSNSR